MTEDMVERVARAIMPEVWATVDSVGFEKLDDWSQSFHALSLSKARAAIEAMREPTREMQEAAYRSVGCGCPCCKWADDWPAMIDAARSEPSSIP